MSSDHDPRIDELIERLARLEQFVGLTPSDRAKAAPPSAPMSAPNQAVRAARDTPPLRPTSPAEHPLEQRAESRGTTDASESAPDAAYVLAPESATPSLTNPDLAEAVARGESVEPDSRVDRRQHSTSPDEHRLAGAERIRDHLRQRASTGLTKSMADIERLIGGRWYAIVGAVVLVIGVGMGLKWAYDAGLLRMPPALRCLAGGVFGAALIVAGQWLRKKVNDWAAVGATAAGLGSMYVSVLAAYKLFTLLPPAAAFAMLAGVSLLGIIISVHSRLAVVGIVSLVTAYITPLIFLDVSSSPLRFALYLVMLLMTGLSVSAWKGRAFASLRTLAWSGTVVWGTLWSFGKARHEVALAMAFLAIVWLMLHAELLWAARHAQLDLPTVTDPDEPPPDVAADAVPGSTRLSRWNTWRPITISLTATFWAVTLGYMVLRANLWPTWPAPAAALLACGTLWLLTASHLDVVRQRPTNDLEVLGVVGAIQIGALLLVTIALALGGPTQVVTWLVLAVAAAAASKRLCATAIFYYAIIPASIATLRLILWESWQTGLHSGGCHVLGLQLTPWTVVMIGASGAWVAVSRFAPVASGALRIAFSAMALMLLMATPLHLRSGPLAIAGVWLTISLGIAVYLYLRREREPWRLIFAGAPASFATLAIFGNTPMIGNGGDGLALLGLHLTPWTWFMVGASVVWAALGVIAIRFLPRVTLAGTVLVVMLLLMTSPAHPLSERMSLAAFWLAIALFVAVLARSPKLAFPAVFFFSLLPAALAAGTLLSARPSLDAATLASISRVLGLHFAAWSWMMIAAGVAWLGLALLSPREGDARVAPGMAITSVVLVMLAGSDPGSADVSAWSWWFVWAVIPGFAQPIVPKLRLILAALVGAILCSFSWIVQFVPHWTRHDAPPLLHPGLVTGLLLAAQWTLGAVWLARVAPPESTQFHTARNSRIVASIIALFTCTSLEAARIVLRISDDPAARGAGVSLWWGVFAAGLLVAGFWRRNSPLRWSGLVLLGVTSLKLVIIDLATVPMLWRTISFLALGLLMIAVPVAYARLGKRESDQPPNDPPQSDSPPDAIEPSASPGDPGPSTQTPPNS